MSGSIQHHGGGTPDRSDGGGRGPSRPPNSPAPTGIAGAGFESSGPGIPQAALSVRDGDRLSTIRESSRLARPRTATLAFRVLLYGAAILLVATVAGGFVLPVPWAWSIGFIYILYDTWLLATMVRASRRAVLDASPAPPVPGPDGPGPSLAVLVAFRNERTVLPQTISALLDQTERAEAIVLVDDGSTDDSIAWVRSAYGVEFESDLGRSRIAPSLLVLRKPHSGKASSLNRALSIVDSDVIVTIDADTMLEPGALAAVRRGFASDRSLTAACGVLAPVCTGGRGASAFQLFQTFEYLRAFLWRLAWMRDRTLVLVSGAFAAYRRTPLVEIGGFDATSRVEDYEVMFRLHRASLEQGRPLSVAVLADARAVTDAPAGVRAFLRQRTRWFAGFLETMHRNADLVGSSRHGRFGTYHLPVKTIDMLLPVYGFVATATLALLVATGRGLDSRILAVVVAKLLFDIVCYARCIELFERWQGRRPTARLYGRALLATLTEPVCFQLLRQLGAVLGWIAYVRGRIEWSPTRSGVIGETTP